MKVGKINSSQDGIIFDIHGEVQCLSSGHGNVPKILIPPPMDIKIIGNIYPSGHEAGNVHDPNGISPTLKCNGPRSNLKKASPMILQINPSLESGGKQPFQQNRIYDVEGELPALSAQMSSGTHAIQVKSATKDGFEIATEGDSINLSMPNSKTRRGRVGVGVAQTLDTQSNQAVVIAQRGRGEKGEIKQQLESNNTGNTNTLTGVQKDNMLLLEGNIRRLTEIECERLQGFADNHTKFGNYDGEAKEVSRTQRYKMCGNAVTVDIVELIANKLPPGEYVHIDLFAGIGGMHEALKRAGIIFTHHYFSEIDKHAIANYKYNYPDAEYIGSVLNVSGAAIRAKHPGAKIIITFGWPCQDNSIAGNRKGQKSGTRSGLLFEAVRIIDESKPQYFIAENVKGLYSVNEGNDFYEAIRLLTYLNSDRPQYALEMQLLNTKWVLPQNRERTYFVGHIAETGGSIKRVFPITENDCRSSKGPSDPTSVRTITGGGGTAEGCTAA